MVLCKTRPRSRKKFTHTHTDTLADNCNNNKDKLKVLEHTPMTTMRITATTTIAYTLGQKAKAENRKGWQTVKAVKALTCSQSVIPSLNGWRDG
jgi:hypothetical protein